MNLCFSYQSIYTEYKESTSLHSKVLTGFSKNLILTEILSFSEKPSQNLVVHDFTLLLRPFESELTHYVTSTNHLNVR